MTHANSAQKILLSFFVFLAVFASTAMAATISTSIGSYQTDLYKNDVISVPVTVTLSNLTGSVTVTVAPKSGLSCSSCSNTLTFSAAGTQSTSFSLTASQAGTYTSPFTVTATQESTTGTATGSNTITVSEIPSWTLGLASSRSTITAGQTATITLTITTFGTHTGTSATISIPSGWTLSSGSSTQTIGTVTGTATATWVVTAGSTVSSSNTVSVAVGSTSPSKSESTSVTITGTSSSNNPSGSGSSSPYSTPTPTPTAQASATPTASATPAASATPRASPQPTAAASTTPTTIPLGSGGSVTGTIGSTSSTFVLSYTAPTGGFVGTLTYRLPFSFADYKAGLITFSPTPTSVTEGSVVAAWDVNLAAGAKFASTVTVNKKIDAAVLNQFAAPVAAAKPAGTATVGPQGGKTVPGTNVGGIDMITIIIALVVLVAIAFGIYLYIGRKK